MDKNFIQMDCMCKNTCTILRLYRLIDKIPEKEMCLYWLQVYTSYKLPTKYLTITLRETDIALILRCIYESICGDIKLNKRELTLSIQYNPMVHTLSIMLLKKRKCIWEVVIDEAESKEVKTKLSEWIKYSSPYPDYL